MKRGLLLLSIICALACNQETTIGTNLLPDSEINIAFTDTVSLSATTIPGDSLLVFVVGEFGNTNLSRAIIGQSDESSFGKVNTFTYFNVNLNGSDTISFDNAFIDSAVLTIPLDTGYTFGPENARFNYKLFKLNESLEDIDSFFTNSFFDYDPIEVGSREYAPNIKDSLEIYFPETDSIIPLVPHLRIPLTDQSFIDNLLNSAIDAESDTIFRENNFGFALTAETNDNAFIALNMANEGTALRRLTVYYTTQDDEKLEYGFPIGSIRSYAFSHDYSGSDVESAIDDQAFSDSLLYIQGLLGPNIEIDLSSALALTPGTVNYAELELHLANVMGNNTDEPIESLGAFFVNDDGDIELIEDFDIGNSLLVPEFFDGNLSTQNEVNSYKLVITHHILNIVNDRIENKKIILVPVNKQRQANRSIIYGAENSQNPVKLKLIRSNP